LKRLAKLLLIVSPVIIVLIIIIIPGVFNSKVEHSVVTESKGNNADSSLAREKVEKNKTKASLAYLLSKNSCLLERKLLSENFVEGDLQNAYDPKLFIKEIIPGHFVSTNKNENLIVAVIEGFSHAEGVRKVIFVVYDKELKTKVSERCENISGEIIQYGVYEGKTKSHILFLWTDGNQGYFFWKGTLISFSENGKYTTKTIYKYEGLVSNEKNYNASTPIVKEGISYYKRKEVYIQDNKIITDVGNFIWNSEKEEFKKF